MYSGTRDRHGWRTCLETYDSHRRYSDSIGSHGDDIDRVPRDVVRCIRGAKRFREVIFRDCGETSLCIHTEKAWVMLGEGAGIRRGRGGGRSRSRWSAVRYTPPQTYEAHCVPLEAHTPRRGGFTAAVEIRGKIRPPL